MYLVLVEKYVQVSTGATAKYEPRKTNQLRFGLLGPFKSRRYAEQAAVRVASTVGTVSARLLTEEQISDMARDSRLDYALNKVLREYLRHPVTSDSNSTPTSKD